MTPTQFGRLARKVVGAAYGWQTRAARLLDVEVRTVQRWIAKEASIPGPVALALTCLGQKVPRQVPRQRKAGR